jgi:hypothetical protein
VTIRAANPAAAHLCVAPYASTPDAILVESYQYATLATLYADVEAS